MKLYTRPVQTALFVPQVARGGLRVARGAFGYTKNCVLFHKFDTRFSDFKENNLAFKFLNNPFIFDQENTQRLADIFKTKKSHLDFDIALINDETHFPNELSGALWTRLLPYCDFMVLKTIVPKFLCMFGSTYVCESTFSSLARRKNQFRSSLSQGNLEDEIRCETSKLKPNFTELIENKECHSSHGHRPKPKN